jgi:cytochrome P450/NADPH-cytochrome P450 reductase
MDATAPIPQPKPDPVLGNIRDVDAEAGVQSFMRLARTYGPIFRLDFPGRSVLVVSSRALVDELCDESRFDKKVHHPLEQVRAFAGDGLFTAYTEEPNWGKAHRILMPAFGPLGVREMFDKMIDVADQMLVRWERFGPGTVIDVADNMTRLTLDTIALCAFDYRFNSFYQNEMHPFVGAMVDALHEAGARGRRPELAQRLMLLSNRRYGEDVRHMHEIADELIAERRRDPNRADKNDLLRRMLEGRDPATGESLPDENIRYQMVTFLIAGHETTSGLLSFALYLLLAHPDVLARTRSVVDEVLGADAPRPEHLVRLRWVEQVLMETLRLWPTAPAFGLRAHGDTTIGGRYPVTTADTVMVLVPMLHRDETAWGPDVEAFRPERFDREAEARLPPNSWKPFGNGQRACIGRPFAMQEATLVLAMILQRFDLVAADPHYALRIKETLTLKPEGFHLRAKRRGTASFLTRSAAATVPPRPLAPALQSASSAAAEPRLPLLVLYGSNSGSAEGFAQRIASEAAGHGYAAAAGPMDEHAEALPTAGAVIVVTASYEGHPPDNARQFVAALKAAKPGAHAGVKYAVFGVGNRQWARTYQAVPIQVDTGLAAAGATRIRARSEADASGDFFGAFEEWFAGIWQDVDAALGREGVAAAKYEGLQVEPVRDERSAILRAGDLGAGQVVENRELVDMTAPQARSKRHFEIALPAGMTYRAGDYLALLPRNPQVNVDRALRRFGFAADDQVILHKGASTLTWLPTEHPITVAELLASYVELAQPATRGQVEALAAATRCPPEKQELEALAPADAYRDQVLAKRVSVLDLIERCPSLELPLGRFLEMVPALKPRQYSISSSPLWNAQHCTLTVAVIDAPAFSGNGRYLGVASHHLSRSPPGTRVAVAVRPSQERFHPPADPRTPMIMICAGSGIAPFRGFIQERAMQAAAGQEVGPALLFFGCDHPDIDFLYLKELEGWQAKGVVDLRPAFTLAPVDDVEFVQHRVWKDRAQVAELFRRGATVYLCGDGQRMAPAVREVLVRIYAEATGASTEEAERWAVETERERGRFVADVFA